MIAACMDHKEVVNSLLSHNPHVNAQDDYGNTALHWATKKGHANLVKMLLNSGADTGIKDKYGKTALDYAKEGGEQEIVTLLEKAAQPKSDVSKTVTESFEQLSM